MAAKLVILTSQNPISADTINKIISFSELNALTHVSRWSAIILLTSVCSGPFLKTIGQMSLEVVSLCRLEEAATVLMWRVAFRRVSMGLLSVQSSTHRLCAEGNGPRVCIVSFSVGDQEESEKCHYGCWEGRQRGP